MKNFSLYGLGVVLFLFAVGCQSHRTSDNEFDAIIKNATIYSTYSPCLLCTKMIINSGISEVVYNEEYPVAETALRLLGEAGVHARKIKVS